MSGYNPYTGGAPPPGPPPGAPPPGPPPGYNPYGVPVHYPHGYAVPPSWAHYYHPYLPPGGPPGARPTQAPGGEDQRKRPRDGRAAQHGDGKGNKFSCRIEVGLENDRDFGVAKRVIQVARQIWEMDRDFKEHGGKTRLRGRDLGGDHESDDPLTLHISCFNKEAMEGARRTARDELAKVRADYADFREEHGLGPIPDFIEHPSDDDDTVDPDRERRKRPRDGPPSKKYDPPPPEDIELLIEERNQARKNKDFQKADEIRDMLKENGIILMDEKGPKPRNGQIKGAEITQWRYWQE